MPTDNQGMLHVLQRHPIAVKAHFQFSLVLTYAYPRELLESLLPPGMELDTFGDLGFLAIAMVQTQRLRPAGVPRVLGRDFFLTGYRIFVRRSDRDGRTRRGLRILRSDTNSRVMKCFGNRLTHYNYRLARVRWTQSATTLTVDISTPTGEADLRVRADLSAPSETLQATSPFPDLAAARRFAGPLPFTFDYEPQTHSIIRIKGVREHWDPRPVAVDVSEATFLRRPPFDAVAPRLANAFYLEDVPYRWERGERERL